MVKEKNTRVQTRVTDDFKEELDEVLKDINSKRNPNLKKFGVRNILYDFVSDYYKTQPYGLVHENKELNKRLDEINEEIDKLTKEKDKITAQINVNNNIINSTKLDDFKDKYTLKLEEAKEDYNKRLSRFGDRVDKEELLINVCKKYEIENINDLKEIL